MRIRVSRLQVASWTFLLCGLLFSSIPSFSQLSVGSSALNFGTVQVGSSSMLAVSVSNPGRTTLVISNIAVSGNGFSFAGPNPPLSLASRQSVSLLVAFAPQTAGTVTGALAIVSEYSSRNNWRERKNTTTVSLSAGAPTAGYISPSATALNFGNTLVGTSLTSSVTLTNSGGSSVSISQAAVSGSGFSLSNFPGPLALAAGQSTTLSVIFTPTVSGSSSGTLTVASNASDPAISVALSGNGTSVGQLSLSPASLSFGAIDIGTTESLSGTITASGASITISSISSTSSQFNLGGLTLPVTIAAGQSAPFSITFAPQTSGAASGSFSFVSNASNSPSTESVSGTGQTVQHTVALSWNASTSSVSGYNVYRSAAASGPYSKLDSSLDPATSYSDSTVQSGQTYYYVTTAVDSAGLESGYSNQVAVQVPTP
jgi:hypothetical protein